MALLCYFVLAWHCPLALTFSFTAKDVLWLRYYKKQVGDSKKRTYSFSAPHCKESNYFIMLCSPLENTHTIIHKRSSIFPLFLLRLYQLLNLSFYYTWRAIRINRRCRTITLIQAECPVHLLIMDYTNESKFLMSNVKQRRAIALMEQKPCLFCKGNGSERACVINFLSLWFDGLVLNSSADNRRQTDNVKMLRRRHMIIYCHCVLLRLDDPVQSVQ